MLKQIPTRIETNGTQGDDETQNATDSLTPQQALAVELLLKGATVTATAQQIGVGRETVHRWLRKEWTFVAALNAAKKELRDAAASRLFAAVEKASENIAHAVESGDLRVSLILLRGVGALNATVSEIGSDNAVRLANEARLTEAETRNADTLRALTVSLCD
jgi:transposase-like protein